MKTTTNQNNVALFTRATLERTKFTDMSSSELVDKLQEHFKTLEFQISKRKKDESYEELLSNENFGKVLYRKWDLEKILIYLKVIGNVSLITSDNKIVDLFVNEKLTTDEIESLREKYANTEVYGKQRISW